MDMFPNPIAPAWLLLYAMAMLGPRVNASLVPDLDFTSGIPATEIARSRVPVCRVALVSVDVGPVSAHAVAVPNPSASSGAPATTTVAWANLRISIPLDLAIDVRVRGTLFAVRG